MCYFGFGWGKLVNPLARYVFAIEGYELGWCWFGGEKIQNREVILGGGINVWRGGVVWSFLQGLALLFWIFWCGV